MASLLNSVPAQIGGSRVVGDTASQQTDGEQVVENPVALRRGEAEDEKAELHNIKVSPALHVY